MALVTTAQQGNESEEMTDTSARTSAGLDENFVPDIGFSVEELQYLLSLAPREGAEAIAGLLNVAPVPPIEETILLGGAALLARGQLELGDEGEFRVVDAALVIAYILNNAVRWSRISGATSESADMGIFVESPQGGILAQPRTLGTWWFIILDPSSSAEQIVVESALGLTEPEETTGVVVEMQTPVLARTFSIRRNGDDWAYAYGDTTGEAPESTVEAVTVEHVRQQLAEFVASFGDQA